jgi:hypothetical protein
MDIQKRDDGENSDQFSSQFHRFTPNSETRN